MQTLRGFQDYRSTTKDKVATPAGVVKEIKVEKTWRRPTLAQKRLGDNILKPLPQPTFHQINTN